MLRAAAEIARETLANPPKNEDQVLQTFDDGYYWYDLRKSACEIEGRAMKHCGSADRGTLYSLRTGEKRRDRDPLIMKKRAAGSSQEQPRS